MALALTPDFEARVQAYAASGRYHDEQAVLAEALSLLEERDRLRAFVQVGLDELDRGEGVDGERAFRELKDRAAEMDRR